MQWCAPHVVVGQSTSLDSHGSLNSPRCESCHNYSTVPHPDVHTIAATQWCTQAMVHRQCNGACFASGGSLLSTIRASAPASSRAGPRQPVQSRREPQQRTHIVVRLYVLSRLWCTHMYCTVMRVRVPLDSTDYETQRVHVPLGCVFADFRLCYPPPPRPPPTFTPIKPNNTDGVNYMYRCHRQRHRHSRQTATDCPHHRHARISSTISRTLKSDGSRQCMSTRVT